MLFRSCSLSMTSAALSTRLRERPWAMPASVFIEHGTAAGTYPNKTTTVKLPPGEPRVFELTGLAANTRHFYRLRHRSGTGEFAADPERSFHTARAAGSTFTFTVQADPHLDFGTEPAMYRQSLTNALAAQPDFFVDLGDTFMKYMAFPNPPFQLIQIQPISKLVQGPLLSQRILLLLEIMLSGRVIWEMGTFKHQDFRRLLVNPFW